MGSKVGLKSHARAERSSESSPLNVLSMQRVMTTNHVGDILSNAKMSAALFCSVIATALRVVRTNNLYGTFMQYDACGVLTLSLLPCNCQVLLLLKSNHERRATLIKPFTSFYYHNTTTIIPHSILDQLVTGHRCAKLSQILIIDEVRLMSKTAWVICN